MEKPVLYKVEDAVATITLNRPDAMNTIDWELPKEVARLLAETDKDGNVRAIVITGAGRAFCAGGDLSVLKALTTPAERHEFIAVGGRMAQMIRSVGKPVVAMVNGVAAGAGFNIALASDMVVCTTKARFAQSFAGVALVPDLGGHYMLPRLIGLHKAKELMFLADLINAEEAYRLGLVNYVVEESQLAEKTYAIAKRLAAGPPLALQFIKSALNHSFDSSWNAMLEEETTHQALCLCTEDHQEGVKAFFEKRPPQYTGR